MPETLRTRLRQLINARHSGSVNAAAKAMRVPQRTLAAVISDDIKHPRADLIQRIASFHQVSTDWLLTGKGEGPSQRDPFSLHQEQLRWFQLVIDLKLKEPVHSAMLSLPNGIADAAVHFKFTALGRGTERRFRDHPTAKTRVDVSPRMVEAIHREYAAWTDWLEDWIEAEGTAKVSGELQRSHDWIRARFGAEAYLALSTQPRND